MPINLGITLVLSIMKTGRKLIIVGFLFTLAGCSGVETVTVEKRGKLTIVHHTSHRNGESIDRMDAISNDGRVRTLEMRQSEDLPTQAGASVPSKVAKGPDIRAALAAAKAKQAQLKAKLADAKANDDSALQGQLQAVESDNDRMQKLVDQMMGPSKHTEAAQ